MRHPLLFAVLALALAPAAIATHVAWRLPSPGSLSAGAGPGDTLVVHSAGYPNDAEVAELQRFPGRVGLVLWSRLPGPHDLALLDRVPGAITFVLRAYPTENELEYLGRLTVPTRVVIAGGGVPPALDPFSYIDPLGMTWPDRRTTEILARHGAPQLLILRGSYPDHVMADALAPLPADTKIVLNAALTAGPPTSGVPRSIEVRTSGRWLYPSELANWLNQTAPGPHRRIAEAR